MRLGLKLVLVQQVNKSKVEADVERLKVRMMWDVYRKWVADERSIYGGDEEVQDAQCFKNVHVTGRIQHSHFFQKCFSM